MLYKQSVLLINHYRFGIRATLGLLGSLVWSFFLVRFPGSFITNKKFSRCNLFLTSCHVVCVAVGDLRSGKRFFGITHNHISLTVVTEGRITRMLALPLN